MRLTKEQIKSPNRRDKEIIDAMRFFGYSLDRDFDVCENGEVWIGLTMIVPKSHPRLGELIWKHRRET